MPRKAIIIGGGIGGLAAALGLRASGVDVEVFERVGALREVGAGLSIWGNGVRALKLLGMEARIAALSIPELAGGLRTADGRLLAGATAADLERTTGEPTVVMHRADLHAALLAELGAGAVRLGKELVAFSQDGGGVTARFADGTAAGGDLLIGADGLRSRVRAQLHGDKEPAYAGYTAWRSVIAFDEARLTPGETWGRGARFGQVPLGGGRVYWFATKTTAAGGRSPDGERAELERTFRGWHAPIEALIAASDEAAILRNDICDRPPLRAWGRDRTTLLGDAAHPMTPNLGQGACQALEDAVVLARCLRGRSDIAAALREYETRRIPRTSSIVTLSRRIGAVGQWRGGLAVALRDWLFGRLPDGLQERQLAQIVNYEF